MLLARIFLVWCRALQRRSAGDCVWDGVRPAMEERPMSLTEEQRVVERTARDVRWLENVPIIGTLFLVLGWAMVVAWPGFAARLGPLLYRSADGFGVLAAVSAVWAVYGLAKRLWAWWAAHPSEEAAAAVLVWVCYAVVPTLLVVSLAGLVSWFQGLGILPHG